MTPAAVTEMHTRLLRCTLEIENSRAWWSHHADVGNENDVAKRAFEESWFGARSLPRVKVWLTNFRVRFDAYPAALRVLEAWRDMEPGTRALICHWHVQLADPLYRDFAGSFLVERHDAGRPETTRDAVTRWVDEQGPGRWTMKTRQQFASQLLVTAKAAGLVKNLKDPRQLQFPRVDDLALTYLAYLLRGVSFPGTLLDNPWLSSVGLTPQLAADRFRALPALRFRQQASLFDFGWVYADIEAWARHTVAPVDDDRDRGAA